MPQEMNILLVEDDDIDAEFLQRALRKIASHGKVVRARDGIEALEILEGNLNGEIIPRPFLVLLDINMPRMNGHEFLSAMRATDEISGTRVFFFTTSDNPRDIDLACENNACGFIKKPNGSTDLINKLQALENFWNICEHPVNR